MKLVVDDGLTVKIDSLSHNIDSNSIDIVISNDIEDGCFQENIRNWDIQAMPLGDRVWTVYYYDGFKIEQ